MHSILRSSCRFTSRFFARQTDRQMSTFVITMSATSSCPTNCRRCATDVNLSEDSTWCITIHPVTSDCLPPPCLPSARVVLRKLIRGVEFHANIEFSWITQATVRLTSRKGHNRARHTRSEAGRGIFAFPGLVFFLFLFLFFDIDQNWDNFTSRAGEIRESRANNARSASYQCRLQSLRYPNWSKMMGTDPLAFLRGKCFSDSNAFEPCILWVNDWKLDQGVERVDGERYWSAKRFYWPPRWLILNLQSGPPLASEIYYLPLAAISLSFESIILETSHGLEIVTNRSCETIR